MSCQFLPLLSFVSKKQDFSKIVALNVANSRWALKLKLYNERPRDKAELPDLQPCRVTPRRYISHIPSMPEITHGDIEGGNNPGVLPVALACCL